MRCRTKFTCSVLFHVLFCTFSFGQIPLITHDSLPESSFFQKDKYIYPWYLQRAAKGRYRNKLTGKKIHKVDTIGTKQLETSILVRFDSLPERVVPDTLNSVFVRAMLHGDTLMIELPFQDNPAEGRVQFLAENTNVTWKLFSETGNKNKSPQPVRVEVYRLILNRYVYKKGDLILAKLRFSLGFDLNDVARGPYPKRVYYEAWIKCRVE
jgi:hypothetical protein